MDIKKDMQVYDIHEKKWWVVNGVEDGIVYLLGSNNYGFKKVTIEEFEELWDSSSLNPSRKEVVTKKEVYEVKCWWVDANGNKIDNKPCFRYVVASSEEEVSQKMEVYKKQLLEKGCATLTWTEPFCIFMYNVID